MSRTWRLLQHGPIDGALNMAIDRAVQVCREEGSSPPTLRLYRWTAPTVTLGRFQHEGDIDGAFCTAQGIGIARRPTGGRGVLHDDEVTYSVVASVADGAPRGVSASYRWLAEPLLVAHSILGVEASVKRNRPDATSAACYLVSTEADLTAGDRKLSGSAQVWHRDTLLQHGSFVRSRDVDREARVFRLSDEQGDALANTTHVLCDASGSGPDESEIRISVSNAFEQVLGIRFTHGSLTLREAQVVRLLLEGHDPVST